jgi:nitrogen fixation protein FixH
MTLSEKNKARFWASVPVALLGGLVATVLGFVHVALSDPSFAVEDRYYTKALSWDEHLAAERRSAALGWHASVLTARAANGDTDLTVKLVDRDGLPVHGARVDAEAFAVARSRRVVRTTFVESAPGDYRAHVVTDRGGRWELSMDASRGKDRFTSTTVKDLEAAP